MEADSSCSEQSAESRGSCSEGFGSRSYDEAVAEASKSCSSLEDLATNERKNWKGSQIASLSHKLFHSTKVTVMVIKPKIAYGIVNNDKSSEHDFILSSRVENQSREEALHLLIYLQYLLIHTMSLAYSSREETSNQSCSRTEVQRNGDRNTILRG